MRRPRLRQQCRCCHRLRLHLPPLRWRLPRKRRSSTQLRRRQQRARTTNK
jgi:hypothetical protein